MEDPVGGVTPPSLLLRLPMEIRLHIYTYLLSVQEKTVKIRISRPGIPCKAHDISPANPHQRRSSLRYVSDRIRGGTAESTYAWTPLAGQLVLHTAILGVNHQIHEEACDTLYSKCCFDFGRDIECIIPFLWDLTDVARNSIRHISLTKRALTNTRDFDHCEWEMACDYMLQHLSLDRLNLGVYGVRPTKAGRPVENWAKTSGYESFLPRILDSQSEMEWARQLARINGLKELKIKAITEDCLEPNSEYMLYFAHFSACIETDFALWMRSQMVSI